MTQMKHPAIAGASTVLETKDEGGGNKTGGVGEVKQQVADFMNAFDEFKKTNDARIEELTKQKSVDVLTEEKLTKINADLDKLEDMNQRITKAEKTADEIKRVDDRFDELETMLKRTQKGGEDKAAFDVNEWARAVLQATSMGVANLSAEQQKLLSDIQTEYKALNVSTNTEGGYLAPVEYVREIIKAVTEISPVRSLARVRQTGSKSIEVPKRTGQFAAQWVSEVGTRSETTGLNWGLEEITAHEFYALVDITNQMFEDTVFNIQAELTEESAEQFALAEGTAFVNGSGVGQPEGFMQNGDVGTTNSGSAATIADANGQADGLITLKHALKTAYTRNATWLMNRTTLGAVRKLKDANNQYLWMPGIAMGKPNTIDGDPYVEMPDMPNEGAGNKPIAYGDFRRAYTWVDRISMDMLRDPYTQATSGKVRHIMRKRVGGKVMLAEAIRTLTCSA